ncbi:MAG: ATP-binding cassette domain-containing protein [Chloroflexota bacterium]|nr:MAG: ATP-binding cassette domain-containing protein [Chloroflexota bacterium]
MNQVEVSHISKSFGSVQAVQDVTFEVQRGEIFGLLGPNGAGKTTTIRVMLDIFKPDSGTVSILGGPMNEEKKDLIGYMPEERGLYQDIPLERCLIYLATLKGLSANEARDRLQEYLERFDLLPHKNKKIKELSKGMQQKAQIIVAILHQPNLIIIDEPFTSLDPINTQLVKDLMSELREQGTTIIMSTHQMHQVEELSDRILLINEGENVLYGNLESIRREHAGHAVMVRTSGEIPQLPHVESAVQHNNATRLILSESSSPQEVLESLVKHGIPLEKFEIALPTLDEIFIKVVKEAG